MNLHSDFVDRLTERVKFDRYGFLAFALGGSVFIIAAKALGLSATWAALGAVLIMSAYAYLVLNTDLGRVRADQAGDNCYYLGLVFTLASLAYTIFTFDPDNTATTIVQGFGVALATTVLGLILRVFFGQTRVDLVEIEDKARFELTEAANQLKASLSQVSVSMNEFNRETRQSIDEARDEMLVSIQAAFEAGAGAITKLSKTASESLEANFTELGARSKRLGASTSRVVNALEDQGERFEQLGAASTKAANGLSIVASKAEAATAGFTDVADQARALIATQATYSAEMATLTGILETQAKAVASLEAALAAMQVNIANNLTAIEKAPSRTLKVATESFSAATAQMQQDASLLSEASRAVLKTIAGELASTAEAVRAHNTALETDLGLSRSNVGKVHAALVEMTGNLAAQIEARRTS